MRKSGQRGQAVIQTAGLLFVMLLTGAFAVDAGLYFAIHRGMQNAADASALAGVAELFRSTESSSSGKMYDAVASAKSLSVENMDNSLEDTDVEFGFVDPATGIYDSSTFSTPSNDTDFTPTGGFNAVRVTVKAAEGEANTPIPAIFAKYLGFENFASQAQAVAIWGGGITAAGGLRPIYLCQEAYDTALNNFGDVTAPEITFFGNTINVGGTSVDAASSCGTFGSGNWGFADLANGGGAPGSETVEGWFEDGFEDQVEVGKKYDAMPGAEIHKYAGELENLKNNQTVIDVPLYDSSESNGSNQKVNVSMIASFVITDYKTTGPVAGRYIKGYFRRSVCSNNCSGGGDAGSGTMARLRLVH